MSTSSHRDLILDQFTRQAAPFSTAKTIASEEALRRLVVACGAGPADRVLDVACGGGLVVCAFARVVRHAEGIDTPRRTSYELQDELENLLRRSFPNPGDDDKIRAMFRASAADDRLGIPIRLEGDRLHYAYPVAILVADRPA